MEKETVRKFIESAITQLFYQLKASSQKEKKLHHDMLSPYHVCIRNFVCLRVQQLLNTVEPDILFFLVEYAYAVSPHSSIPKIAAPNTFPNRFFFTKVSYIVGFFRIKIRCSPRLRLGLSNNLFSLSKDSPFFYRTLTRQIL